MHSIVDSGPRPPCPDPFNMAAHVLAQADRLDDKIAVAVIGGARPETLSYAALKRAVLGTGGGLRAAGFEPGDRILMRLGNTLDFPIAYLGALAVGLVPVPTSAALTEPEVGYIIDTLRPRVVLRDPEVASAPGAPEIGLHTLRSLRDHPPERFDMGMPDRPGYIVFTSGTSGAPRAVEHAHRAIWARQMMLQGWYGLRETDVLLHAGAFNWTYTMGTGLMDPWTVGATALIPVPGTRPDALPALLEEHRATLFAAAPGVYRQMLSRAEVPPLPHLRHGLSAGEKLPARMHAAWHEATGTRVYEAFGMSECSTFISGCPERPADPATLGRPQPGRRVAVVDDDGPVPLDTPGVIAIDKGDPGLMLRYVDQPAETAERFRGPWFLTGDIGRMDADGQITYLGRNDDMLNAGGYRVSPIEVENALSGAPGVSGCGVAEVEIRPGTRIIVAFYTGARALDEAALQGYVEPRLARYKQPRAYIHVPQLPTGPNGKLLRRRLPQFWPATRNT